MTIGLAAMDDGAAIRIGDRWLVITTDSHVIHPVFFPGGDIGRLAVSGTVNDLAMMGATEVLALTCAVIIEEGFAAQDLERIQRSIRTPAPRRAAPIVTGDTKVMGKGELDGIVLNTTGVALTGRVVPDSGLLPGDRIIVTGTIGDHGMAVMAGRHGLALDGDLRSDVAPINGLIRAALAAVGRRRRRDEGPHSRWTRFGASTRWRRRAASASSSTRSAVPVTRAGARRRRAPWHRSAARRQRRESRARRPARRRRCGSRLRCRLIRLGGDAAIIGTCTAERPGTVVLDTGFGRRLVTEPEGELLPRIC